MPEALPYMIYLVLLQHASMLFMHSATFLILSHTFYTKFRSLKGGEISAPFILYLSTILAMSLLGLINSSYIVGLWWKGSNNGIIIYVTTAAVLMILPISSISIFFLILHRILIINRCLARSSIHQCLLFCCAVLMLLLFGATVAYFLWAASFIAYPVPTNCWSVTCVVYNGSVFSVWAKFITGFFNAIIGTWFFYELKKSQKKYHGSHRFCDKINRKRANKLALFTIGSEIVLSSIPAFIDLFLRMTINLSLTQYVNSYSFVFGAADGTFMAFLYSKNFKTFKKLKIVKVTTISSNTWKGNRIR